MATQDTLPVEQQKKFNKDDLFTMVKVTLVAAVVIFIAQFVIGKKAITMGSVTLTILPMLFAVMIRSEERRVGKEC